MKHYLLAIGGTGSRVLESVIWSACAGTLCSPKGETPDSLRMLMIDTDRANERFARLDALVRCVNHVRTSLPNAHHAFSTALQLSAWKVALPGTVGTLRSMAKSEQDRLLLDTLFPEEDSAIRLGSGLRGHADAGMLLFSDALRNASEPGHPLSGMLWDMQEALETGETVRIMLCGAAFGATGSSGVCMLARYLRRLFGGAGNLLQLGALMLTPYEKHSDDDGAALRSRAALENMAVSGMLDSDTAHGVLDALYVLGMPEACHQPAAAHDALLPHWLAACCIGDFHTRSNEALRGAYYWQTPEEYFAWDSFGAHTAVMQERTGRFLRCAALFLCEFENSLDEKLQEKAQLKDMLAGWFAANFRTLRHADDDTLHTEHALLQSVMTCLRGFTEYMTQLVAALPLQYRAGSKHMQLVRQAAEHYRQWLQMAGRIYLLEEEIHRSGLEEEQFVTRSASQLSAAEEMLQLTEEKYAELSVLTAEQAALDRQIGSGSKYRLMKRMLRGIDRALEQDGQRAAENRRILEEALRNVSGTAAEQTLRADREALYHLESHLELLRAQRVTLRNELTAFERKQQYTTAPDIPPEERTLPSCELFDGEILVALTALAAIGDEKRQRSQLVRRIEERYGALVQPEDNHSVREILAALGKAQEHEGKGPAMGRFIARVLALSGKEANA